MVDFQLSEKEKRLFECLKSKARASAAILGNDFSGVLKYVLFCLCILSNR